MVFMEKLEKKNIDAHQNTQLKNETKTKTKKRDLNDKKTGKNRKIDEKKPLKCNILIFHETKAKKQGKKELPQKKEKKNTKKRKEKNKNKKD